MKYLGQRYEQLPGESNVDYFNRRILIRQQENEAWANAATVNIAYGGNKSKYGKKITGNAQTVMQVEAALRDAKDFGLISPVKSKVFFIGGELMCTFHPTMLSANSVTKLVPTTINNALSLAIAGHSEFMLYSEMMQDTAYITFAKAWYGDDWEPFPIKRLVYGVWSK